MQRLAILPASVLIGDLGHEWLATAIPVVLQQDLATSPAMLAAFAPSASAAYQLDSAQIVRLVVEERQSRYRVQATVTSTSTQQDEQVAEAQGPVSGGIIAVLNELARKLDPSHASAFSTKSEQALKLFATAVIAPDATTRTALLEQGVQADPAFGLAHIARLENAPQPAAPINVDASGFVPLDRVRWQALQSRLRHVSLDEQAKAEAAVLALAPNNVEALAALGLRRFLQGQAAQGRELLQKAMTLNPANGVLSLQLVQGFVAAGEFTQALQILTPLAGKNPNLLPGVALVQLLDGKKQEAEQTLQHFMSLLPPGNPAVSALDAQWQRFTDLNASPELPQTLEFWQEAVKNSGDTNLAARAMVAAFLERAGKSQEARAVRVMPFLPEFTDPNAPVEFNAIRRFWKR